MKHGSHKKDAYTLQQWLQCIGINLLEPLPLGFIRFFTAILVPQETDSTEQNIRYNHQIEYTHVQATAYFVARRITSASYVRLHCSPAHGTLAVRVRGNKHEHECQC